MTEFGTGRLPLSRLCKWTPRQPSRNRWNNRNIPQCRPCSIVSAPARSLSMQRR